MEWYYAIMCLLDFYYASNNELLCFANKSSASAMQGHVFGPAIMAGAWGTNTVRLVGSLAVGRLFGAAEIATHYVDDFLLFIVDSQSRWFSAKVTHSLISCLYLLWSQWNKPITDTMGLSSPRSTIMIQQDQEMNSLFWAAMEYGIASPMKSAWNTSMIIDTKPTSEIGVEMLDEIVSEDPWVLQGIGGDNMTIMVIDLLLKLEVVQQRHNFHLL
jgi:hypothetical protein